MTSEDLMRRVHLVVGVATTIAFLASGAYLNHVARPGHMALGPQLMYVTRHIYVLSPGLVHLLLCVCVRVMPHPRVPRLQWAGSVLLVISSALLITAFLIEPCWPREDAC